MLSLYLSALGAFAIALGFGFAALSYPFAARLPLAWETAGALVFFGVAVVILADAGEAIAVFDQMTAPYQR